MRWWRQEKEEWGRRKKRKRLRVRVPGTEKAKSKGETRKIKNIREVRTKKISKTRELKNIKSIYKMHMKANK